MKPESEYLFVEVASKRCLQLMRGAKPKIETGARKYTTLAVAEVEAGEVPWRIREEGEEAKTLVVTEMQEPVVPKADAE